jgi:hypothetical protein
MPMTTTLTLKQRVADLLALSSLDQHPQVKAAHERVAAAQRTLNKVERRYADAREERHRAESAAAEGQRDDKRLRRAQEELDTAVSEVRIATLTLERARDAAKETYNAVCTDVDRDLREHHRDTLHLLAAALRDAKQYSDAAARLEDCSGRLLPGGTYREHPGKPLTTYEGAWRREFGSPGTTAETRFSRWCQFWKLTD